MADTRAAPHGDVTLMMCGSGKCEHQFDGPEVPVSGDPARPMGYTFTCSKCGRRAIDVHLWELP